MVLVTMKEDVVLTQGPVNSGDVVDVSEDVAAALVKDGSASYVDEPEETDDEKATRRERMTKEGGEASEGENASETETKSSRTVENTVQSPDPTGETPRVQTNVERQVTPQRPKPRTE
jgi:hypothetical protein